MSSPRAQHFALRIRQRTNQRDGVDVVGNRQQLGLTFLGAVLQQDDGFFSGFARERPFFRRRLIRRTIFIDIRMIENSEREFDSQHAPDGFIDSRTRGTALLRTRAAKRSWYAPLSMSISKPADDCLLRGGRIVQRNAVRNQFANRAPVADDKSIKVPFLAQNLRQRIRIRRSAGTLFKELKELITVAEPASTAAW